MLFFAADAGTVRALPDDFKCHWNWHRIFFLFLEFASIINSQVCTVVNSASNEVEDDIDGKLMTLNKKHIFHNDAAP